MCPHTTKYVVDICSLVLLYVCLFILLYMCMCVFILQYMRPHTTTYVAWEGCGSDTHPRCGNVAKARRGMYICRECVCVCVCVCVRGKVAALILILSFPLGEFTFFSVFPCVGLLFFLLRGCGESLTRLGVPLK